MFIMQLNPRQLSINTTAYSVLMVVLISLLRSTVLLKKQKNTYFRSNHYFLTRMKIVLTALYKWYTMSQTEIDDYMNAYKFLNNDFRTLQDMKDTLGPNYDAIYKKSQQDYYKVLNYLCAVGQVEKMYLPPLIDKSASPLENQLMFEELMCDDLKLNKNSKVLDMGCGRGTVAMNVHQYSGAAVTGVNIDQVQINHANVTSRKMKNPNKFVHGDFNDESTFGPIESNHYDAAYQIQSVSCVHDKVSYFKNIASKLKKGGKYTALAYCSTENYNRNDAYHYDLMVTTKQLMGAVYSPLPSEYEQWLREAGFKITKSVDLGRQGDDSSVILYKKLNDFYERFEKVIKVLYKVGLLPKHMNTTVHRLNAGGKAWFEVDRLQLVYPTYYIIAEKL